MRIVSVGKGRLGGGLARLWTAAGHDVLSLGRDGGDASSADVILVAVPSSAIGDALSRVSGAVGKTTIDATNIYGDRDAGFSSLAHQVKSILGGPTAKSFNTNWAVLYDQIAGQRVRPSNLFACDPEAREVTEGLISDAGFEPVYVGDLDQAHRLEEHLVLIQTIASAGLGPFFYRMSQPGQL